MLRGKGPWMFRGKGTWVFRGKRTWMMFRVVFVVVFARGNEPEFSRGLIRAQVADFAGRMTNDRQEKKSAAARALHFDSKALASLLLKQGIRLSDAWSVPIEPERALRHF